MHQGVSPGASTEMCGGAGYESRAGHSNVLQERSTTAASAGRRGSEYFPTVTGRMGHILNQESSLAAIFFFLVVIPARGRSQ